MTSARRVAPTCPFDCRRNGQTKKALLSWDSTAGRAAAMPTIGKSTQCRGLFTGTLPAQWLPRWPVLVRAGYSLASSLLPHAFFGYQMVPSKGGSLPERLARGRGRGGGALRGSPDVLRTACGQQPLHCLCCGGRLMPSPVPLQLVFIPGFFNIHLVVL